MSELIATSSGEIRARDALLGYLWYEKSEADKVIAEKDKMIDYTRALVLEDIERIRYQKYKRCLNKSELCHWKASIFLYKKEKSDFYWKWYKRWLEIAENFKEVYQCLNSAVNV